MLLPSNEMRQVSKKAAICITKKMPTGYDVRYRQFYWLLVFNADGGLTHACNLSDALTEAMGKGRKKMALPAAFSTVIDGAFKVGSSLQDLEKAYLQSRGSKEAYQALRERIKDMKGVAQMRLSAFLAEHAGETGDPDLARGRSILVNAEACSHQVINHAAFAALRRETEAYILEFPRHELAHEAVGLLLEVALKYSFDVAAKCHDYAESWKNASNVSAADLESLKSHASRLLALCEEDCGKSRVKLNGMKPEAYGALRLKARLGMSGAVLEGLDAGKTFGVFKPIHREWRKEAEASLHGASDARLRTP